MSTPTAADVRLANTPKNATAYALPPGPETGSLLTVLRTAHERIGSTVDEPTPGLQTVIGDYIGRAKNEGCLIEHAIVRLKRAIADAGLSADSGPRAAINNDVITRCIREYYRR